MSGIDLTKEDYFKNLPAFSTSGSENKTKGMKLADSIAKKMEKQILIEQITIPQQLNSKTLPIKPKTKPQPDSSQTMQKIQSQKQCLMNKIKELGEQQEELKAHMKEKIKNKTQSKNKRQRIQYSEDEEIKFKQIVKSHRRFKKSLDHKDQQFIESCQERSLEDQQKMKELEEQMKQRKRNIILQNLRIMEENTQRRNQINKSSQQKYKEMNQNKYLHQRLSLSEIQKTTHFQAEEAARRSKHFRNGVRVSIQEIQQHQKKHDQSMMQSQIKNSESLRLQMLDRSKQSKSYADNYFQIVLKARMEQQKAQQDQRKREGSQIKQRIKVYKQKVSSEFKPSVSQESKFKPISIAKSTQSLSNVEIHRQGLTYLQKAKQLKDVQKQEKKRSALSTPPPKLQYKDYLKQLKLKPYETAESKFKMFMRDRKSFDDLEEVNKAIELAGNLGYKSKLTPEEQTLKKMQNKLELLKVLE